MPILGEVASRVAEFFTGKPEVEAKAPKLEDKELKKYQSWIKLANYAHKEKVEKPAKKFSDRLKQVFPDVTDDTNQSRLNYYKVNMDRLMPILMPKEIKVSIRPALGKDVIINNGVTFDNRRANIILNEKVGEILKDDATLYTIEAAVFDMVLANLGCVMVGHTANIKTEEVVPEGAAEVLAAKTENGEVIPGETAVKEKTVKEIGQMPRLTIKHEEWRNIKVDPKATEYFFSNARYKVRLVRLPLEEAKRLYGDITLTDVDEYLPIGLAKMDEAKSALLYEIYDLTTDGQVERLTFLGEGAKCVERVMMTYDPAVVCKLNYLSGEVYPPSDFVHYEDLVDEANFYRTTRMNQGSRGAARKVLAAAETIDSENEERLNSDKDLELVTVNLKAGQSLDSVTKILGSASISQDLYAEQKSVAQDIQEVSGVNSTRLGNVANSPATNATLANAAFESITDHKFKIIKHFSKQIVERVIIVLKKISVEQEDLMIKRPDGSVETIKWSNEDIKLAESEIEIDLTPNEPSDQKVKRMLDWCNWLTQPAIAQGLAANGKKFQMDEFVKEVSGSIMPNQMVDRFIVDADKLPDPDHENLLMLAGQAVASQPQEDFKAHIEAHNAFLGHPVLAAAPAVAVAVQEHIAQTEAVMQQQEELKNVNVAPTQKPGPLAAQVREAGVQ